MSSSRAALNLLARNVPLSLSKSKSRRENVTLHASVTGATTSGCVPR